MRPDSLVDFAFARMPEIHIGAGKLRQLPQLIRQWGSRVLLVTGSSSFVHSASCAALLQALQQAGVEVFQASVSGEPSPTFVDQTVECHRNSGLRVVVSIGGGSAVDAGKAISAMLLQEGSVADYLEGMEPRTHDGRKIPFIAVPTSSGTGAEATKNAVLSQTGPQGYKRSLRHDNFVPDVALIDPELMLSCPPEVTAACGLDALTQLLEAYVSTKSSPLSDALALSGLEHLAAGFLPAYERGTSDLAARGHMAYAALLSGVVLANAGLGVVHGFAGPIGGFFPIPHGVVCGTLVGEATRANIESLFGNVELNRESLEKYAKVGALLAGAPAVSLTADCDRLVHTLSAWVELTQIPRLGHYNIQRADFPKILDKSNNKNSPVTLSREQMAAILEARL